MSEAQKFTEDELKKITELRDANAQKINEFGQVELEILLTNQRLETLEFNEKYGTGTVDLESGEFVPKNR